MAFKRLLKTCTAALTLAAISGSAQAQELDIRIGSIFSASVPVVQCGAMVLSENEALNSAGFDISVIHSAQLGSENQLAQQVSSGELEMSVVASSILASWVEALSILETYYLYENVDQVFAAYRTPTAQELFQELLDVSNIRIVGLPWLYGERHIFGSRAIRSPEDTRGLRLRVPETSISIESARSIGASPTPVAYAEVYLALQQGIIDAAEAPASVVMAESFYEPSAVISKTSHLITALPVIVNEQFWQTLTPQQQEMLEAGVVEAAENVRSCAEETDAAAFESWAQSGSIEIVEDVDRDSLREASQAYFSDGFAWSDAYNSLVEQLSQQ